MPEFDIRVLSVGVAVSSILLVVALRLLSHVAADVPAIRAWSQGGVHWLLGFALLGLRGHVPDFVSVVVANVLIVTGSVWLYRGLRLVVQLPQGVRWDLWLGTLATLGLVHSTYIEPSLSHRVVLMSLLPGFVNAMALGVVVRTRSVWRASLRQLPLLLGLVFAGNVVWLVSRAVLASGQHLESTAVAGFQHSQQYTLMGIIALNSVLMLAVTALVASRYQDRLAQHRDELEHTVAERTAQLRMALAAHIVFAFLAVYMPHNVHFRQVVLAFTHAERLAFKKRCRGKAPASTGHILTFHGCSTQFVRSAKTVSLLFLCR